MYWKNSLGEVTRISAGDAKNLAAGTKIYADEELTHEVTLNADGEVEGYSDIETEYESAFVSGIDEFCAGISAATFFGYEESVYGPGVILANLLNTFTDFLSTCINEGLVKSARPTGLRGLSLTVSSAACSRYSASCLRFFCCSCSSRFWKTADIWRA